MKRLRTFIAIEISEEIRQATENLKQELASKNISAKWVLPKSMHITLHFLGEIAERDVPGVCKAMAAVGKKIPPFSLQIAGVGAFPNLRRPKVVWVGLKEGEQFLEQIHNSLVDPLTDLGVYRHEDRRYRPHITLGRVKADEESETISEELPKHAEWIGGQIMVDEIVLFRSDFYDREVEYIPLGRAQLLGKASKKQSEG